MVANSSGRAGRRRCTGHWGWAAKEQPVHRSRGILLLFLLGRTEDTIVQPFIPLETTCSTSRCLCLIQTNVLRLSYVSLWQSFLIRGCVNSIDIFITFGGSRGYFPAGEVLSLQFSIPPAAPTV